MKSGLLLVVLALILAGCNNTTQSPGASTQDGNQSGVTSPAASTQQPATTATTSGEARSPSSSSGVPTKPEIGYSGGAPGSEGNVSKPSEPAIQDPRVKISRLYQLKDLKTAPIKAAGQNIQAWVMNNESKREEGMMFLEDKDVKENQGMIFVFPDVQAASNAFWMHNCPMGLDLIYIDKNKKVLNVGDGLPENDNTVQAAGDYRWVLEMKRGWSKRHGLTKGDTITIPALEAED